MKKEYLNEENYQQVNNKIKSGGKIISNIILVIGLLLIFTGIFLLVSGKEDNTTSENSNDNLIVLKEKEIESEKVNLKNKLSQITSELINKKQELIGKGIKKSSNYNDGEAYDLYIIDNALDPSFNHCWFDQYNENDLTKDYCTLKNITKGDEHYYSCDDNEIIKDYCTLKTELVELQNNKNFPIITHSRTIVYLPFIMIGFFITFVSFVIKLALFSITHRREMLAYSAQQVMPIAKEGAEKMAPTAGKVAKEVVKGIKEGLKDEEK